MSGPTNSTYSSLEPGSNQLSRWREPTPQGLEVLYHIALPAVAGGIVGLIEGVYLGLPLAWLLGMFGGRTAEWARPQA